MFHKKKKNYVLLKKNIVLKISRININCFLYIEKKNIPTHINDSSCDTIKEVNTLLC